MAVIDVTDYGATGDGSTDDTSSINAAITAATAGDTLFFPEPSVFYKITSALVINKSLHVLGEESAIHQTASAGAFQITSNNVSIRHLDIQGLQYASQSAAQVAIQAFGSSTDDPLRNISVYGCVLDTWGMYGVLLKFVDSFEVSNNRVTNINYAGIMGVSVLNGEISTNYVDNVVNTPNAYGIALTRLTTDPGELSVNPRSKQVVVEGNWVSNVLNWEGLDTHSGEYITFRDNILVGCARGIVICDSTNADSVATYGPKNCIASGNRIYSNVTDGSAVFGIAVSGASVAVGSATDLADHCVVSGNLIQGYGVQSSSTGIAVYAVSTSNLTISSNQIIQPSPIGIGIYYDNYGFFVSGNVITDAWSNTTLASCIKIISDYNWGTVDANSYKRGTKTATNILNFGLYVGNFAHNLISLGNNYSVVSGITLVYDPGNHTI